MSNKQYTVEYEGLDIYTSMMFNAPSRYRTATGGLIKQDTNKAKSYAQNFAPKKTGKLRQNIKTHQISEMRFTLYIDDNEVPYGPVQELGSKPYTIYPRHAKVLRFYIGGKPVFARKVQHPGIKGTFFVKRGIATAFTGFAERLKNTHIKVFERLKNNG